MAPRENFPLLSLKDIFLALQQLERALICQISKFYTYIIYVFWTWACLWEEMFHGCAISRLNFLHSNLCDQSFFHHLSYKCDLHIFCLNIQISARNVLYMFYLHVYRQGPRLKFSRVLEPLKNAMTVTDVYNISPPIFLRRNFLIDSATDLKNRSSAFI